MQRAFDQFQDSLKLIRDLDALYVHLVNDLRLPNDLTDILRAEWVYSVSAFDKLIHELVRIGMINSFLGSRPKTATYLNFSISNDTHEKINAASSPAAVPPKEYWFEQEIIQRHKHLSFQDPEKINPALSLIWDEPHKWQKIAGALALPEKDVVTKLKNIVTRRNQIAHESDIDIVTGLRITIVKNDIDDVINFIGSVGKSIFDLVK